MHLPTNLSYLLVLLATFTANLIPTVIALPSPSPQKAGPDTSATNPDPSSSPPVNIDCMVMWSPDSCCSGNMKTSTGTVLVQASGTGKTCPFSLERKSYCLVGDKDCPTSGAKGRRVGMPAAWEAVAVGALVVGTTAVWM
ncbi:hypothetical protein HKX48_004671 [Thoreauomyces humboldtii]|nr:hypothetical protein HKX48_004671 [Thoreauomyces humboldtii]